MSQEQKFNHVHFIGIGGIGMSAVAEVMIERGYTISGSDLNESDQVQMLRGRGATIYVPQRAENITDDIDLVVRSTAIQESNVEYQAAKAKGIPVIHRSEMLGHLMENQKAICVAGFPRKDHNIFDDCSLPGKEWVGSNHRSGWGDQRYWQQRQKRKRRVVCC